MARERKQSVGGFILAAGEGRRLRPLSSGWPKALVPFCGVPLLELAGSLLAGQRLERTVVNCWYHADEVAAATARLAAERGWPLVVSREPHLLGTGGGLRHGAQQLPGVDAILVHNVDVVLDFPLARLIERHIESKAAATLLLVPARGPLTVDLRQDGCIADFRRPRGQGAYTFTGVHILNSDVLAYLPNQDTCSIISAYEAALDAGLAVVGLPIPDECFWVDLGAEERYIDAHGEMRTARITYHSLLQEAAAGQAARRGALVGSGVQCTGALGLGKEVYVTPGARLHNAVLWRNTQLRKAVVYADAVFTGQELSRLPRVTAARRPDPRVYDTLGVYPETCELTALREQGSGRRYARISCGQRSWVWCAYAPERRENSTFVSLARFLRRLGVDVPHVALHLPDVAEIVLQDLGDTSLQQLPEPERSAYLRQVAEMAARLHVLGTRALQAEELPLQPAFNESLYDWERDYFREHMLGSVLEQPEWWERVGAEYSALRSTLLDEPPALIHRDLQSANVMVWEDRAWLIDFQGMRLGCAAYDLGALLYDPYQCHSRAVRGRTWRSYAASVQAHGGVCPAEKVLHAAAVQRLLQALGAYGKLWLLDGFEWYRRFIIPGFDMLREAAGENGEWPAIERLARDCRTAAEARLS